MSMFRAKKTATAISIYGPTGNLSCNLLTSFSEKEINSLLTNYTGADPAGFIKNEEEKKKEGINSLLVEDEEESDDEYFGRRSVPAQKVLSYAPSFTDSRDSGGFCFGISYKGKAFFWSGHYAYTKIKNSIESFIKGNDSFSSHDINIPLDKKLSILSGGVYEEKTLQELDSNLHFLLEISDTEGEGITEILDQLKNVSSFQNIYCEIEKFPRNSDQSINLRLM